jgi:cell division protease FtsH
LNSTLKSLLFWMVLVVVGVLIWNFSTTLQNRDDEISFSQFLADVREKKVASVLIEGNDISGVMNGTTGTGQEKFRTYAPAQYEGLANELQANNVAIKARKEATSPWASLLYSWAPVLLMIGFWIFFMRQMQSGGNKALSFGKSKAKLS